MIEFEWYIKRAKIDLGLFFEVENIKSDEDLAEYCKARSLSLPKEKYFPEETAVEPQLQEEKVVVENKPKRTRKKTTKPAKIEVEVATEVVEEKPARKPRRRTTRKKAAPK